MGGDFAWTNKDNLEPVPKTLPDNFRSNEARVDLAYIDFKPSDWQIARLADDLGFRSQPHTTSYTRRIRFARRRLRAARCGGAGMASWVCDEATSPSDEPRPSRAPDARHRSPDGVHGDPGRLRQVLVNLVGNGVKFTAAGEVRVSADLAGPSTDEGCCVRFEIVDTGIGIPPEVQAQILEPFMQVDESSSRSFGGTASVSPSRGSWSS